MLNLIDTHAHLNNPGLENEVTGIIARATEAGVSTIICSGYDLPSSILAVEIAERCANVWAVVGVHPHDAKTVTDEALSEIRRLAGHPKVVAIGEIGLDYHYDRSPRPVQAEVFRAQLKMAAELGMPVVVHERESGEDAYGILEEFGRRSGEPATSGGEPATSCAGVMHCFAGDVPHAERIMALGFYLGIAGPVTFKKSDTLREVVREAPMDRLLVETDAPYLTPEPLRGRRQNESALVRLVAEKIAEIRAMELAQVAARTTENALRVFPSIGGGVA